MDNLTHSLVGLTASKAGLERWSPYTTAVCLLAANAPDSDIIVLFTSGRWKFLEQHRGISHSILGVLVFALAIPLVFYASDLLIARLRKQKARVKLRGLVLASLIVSATHPFMDWTNNYGIRLLLPWNPKWFYGDLVSIVDPFLWLLFGGAAFLLTSKTRSQKAGWIVLGTLTTAIVVLSSVSRGLTSSTYGLQILWIVALTGFLLLFRLRTGERLGRRVAVTAFAVAILYWSGLAALHSVALREVRREARVIEDQYHEKTVQVAATPTLANPLHWQGVVETENAAYRFEYSLTGQGGTSELVRYARPDLAQPAVAQAEHDERARIFLGFARFPVAQVIGEDCATQTLVQFADLRYTQPGSGRGTFSLDVPVECPTTSKSK